MENRIHLLVATMLMATGLSHADVLKLKRGGDVQGMLISANSREIVFVGTDGGEKTYPLNAVAGLDFAPLPPPPKRVVAAKLTIPAGTHITVRTIDAIDGKTGKPGDTYRASVDDPVGVGSQTAIPRGANCTIEVVSLHAIRQGDGVAREGNQRGRKVLSYVH